MAQYIFLLEIDGQRIPERVFGDDFLWNANLEIFAIQERLTTNEREGPITVLTAFDLEESKEKNVSRATIPSPK